MHVVALWQEANTGDGFASAFDVLGNIGMYLAALRRHELTNPASEEQSPFGEVSSLALHFGVSIGKVPRFSTAHLANHNRSIGGVRMSFTALPDEFLFIDKNARAILSFQRAADALTRILPLGVTNPVADVQFIAASQALRDVIEINTRLFATPDVEGFFFRMRPYYRVGRRAYRCANAADFAGINEIDLLLGLCRANDPDYAKLLVDKMLFMLPADQTRLRECMAHGSLLDEFLFELDAGNVPLFLQAEDDFGQTAALHHDQLVARFIAEPAATLPSDNLVGLTASGPPLNVLVRSLETLRDVRCAARLPHNRSRVKELPRPRSSLSITFHS